MCLFSTVQPMTQQEVDAIAIVEQLAGLIGPHLFLFHCLIRVKTLWNIWELRTSSYLIRSWTCKTFGKESSSAVRILCFFVIQINSCPRLLSLILPSSLVPLVVSAKQSSIRIIKNSICITNAVWTTIMNFATDSAALADLRGSAGTDAPLSPLSLFSRRFWKN